MKFIKLNGFTDAFKTAENYFLFPLIETDQ